LAREPPSKVLQRKVAKSREDLFEERNTEMTNLDKCADRGSGWVSCGNPANPKRMLPAYDNLHLNDAGSKAKVESIDLQLLTGEP
jgi:hypothetical protein